MPTNEELLAQLCDILIESQRSHVEFMQGLDDALTAPDVVDLSGEDVARIMRETVGPAAAKTQEVLRVAEAALAKVTS